MEVPFDVGLADISRTRGMYNLAVSVKKLVTKNFTGLACCIQNSSVICLKRSTRQDIRKMRNCFAQKCCGAMRGFLCLVAQHIVFQRSNTKPAGYEGDDRNGNRCANHKLIVGKPYLCIHTIIYASGWF